MSVSGGRRTLPVGALIAALLVSGCGSSASPKRQTLAAYIEHEQRIELRMQAPLAAITAVGKQVSGSAGLAPSAGRQQRLRSARAALDAVERELAGLPAPASARRLRVLVVKLYSHESQLTHELSAMIGFPSRFGAILQSLNGPRRKLADAFGAHTGVSIATVTAERIAALLGFGRAGLRTAARLRALPTPAVFKPSSQAEERSLLMMTSSAEELVKDLQGNTDPSSALGRLRRAFALADSRVVKRAARAAIRRYDLSVQRAQSLVAQIRQERLRLSDTTG